MDDSLSEHRLVLPEFLSPEECKELMWIHKSCGVVGYRPWVLSTTLCHLVATNCANLMLPLLPIRERVKEVVEEYFGREFELFTEFTGLISWTEGARIGWHSDDNRPYLRQRHYSAVCYLNNYEEDFEGGLFHFENGDPQTIVPTAGTIVIYTADEKNMHSVDQITDGERCTLALWFTLDKAHDEDEKLIQQLDALNFDVCDNLCDQNFEQAGLNLRLPVSAPNVMYNLNGNIQREEPPEGLPEQAPEELLVNDVRVGRMASLGFSCCYTSEVSVDEQDQPLEVVFSGKKVPGVFTNLLHALQVIQFHQYRFSSKNQKSSSGEELERGSKMSSPSPVQSSPRESPTVEEVIFGKVQEELDLGYHLDSMSDGRSRCNSLAKKGRDRQRLETEVFQVSDFTNSWKEWNAYSSNQWEQLLRLLPFWKVSRMLDLLHP